MKKKASTKGPRRRGSRCLPRLFADRTSQRTGWDAIASASQSFSEVGGWPLPGTSGKELERITLPLTAEVGNGRTRIGADLTAGWKGNAVRARRERRK